MVLSVSRKQDFIHPSKEAKFHFQFPEEDINIIQLDKTILFYNKDLLKLKWQDQEFHSIQSFIKTNLVYQKNIY